MEPDDQSKTQNDPAQGDSDNNASPRKPISEWTVEDYLAAGVQAQLSTAKVRVSNTATGVPGGKRTGIEIGRRSGFKFAK